MKRIILVTFLLVTLMAPCRAGAQWEDHDATLSPYFFVHGGEEGVEQFPLKSTSVSVLISGVIADVTVRQEYENTGRKPINAKYIFPASTRAAAHGMTMIVGDDLIKARIKERKEAEKTFEKAKAQGKSASLLSQQRPNLFSMDVANIAPGKTVKIELHYSELLVPTDGTYQFVYPTVVGPRYSEIKGSAAGAHDQWLSNPYLDSHNKSTSKFSIDVTLNAGMPIRDVSCATHQTKAQWKGKNGVVMELAKDETHGGARDFILDYRLDGNRIQTGLLMYEGDEENFFTLMVQPPDRITPEIIPPREYIFVVDVSGSMRGFPLDTSKAVMGMLAENLRPQDKFNLLLFSGSAHLMAEESLPASRANLKKAMDIIDSQRGGGGTRLYSALKTALDLPLSENTSRSIIIVTDGYISAEREVFGLIEGNINRSNLFAFGIGASVNRYLIEGMAAAGQGEPFIVTRPEQAPQAAKRFKSYIESPVLTGIEIDFEGFRASDLEPASHADLFAKRPIIVSGKYRGEPGGSIRISGATGEGAFEKSFDLSDYSPSEANRALPCLWARKRLARLIDYSPRPDNDKNKALITELGLKYSLLTRHTSFVAVHEVISNPSGQARDVKQPLPLPKGVSNSAIQVHNAPEPGIIAVLLLLSLSGYMSFRRRARLKPHNG